MALIFTGLKRNKGPEMIQCSNVLYLLVALLINIKVSFATSKYTFTHTDDSLQLREQNPTFVSWLIQKKSGKTQWRI